VIKREEILDPEYLPSEIFHREKEIERIKGAIGPIFKGKKGENLFIYGEPGVGKTTTIKFVLSKLGDVKGIYINCWNYRTPHSFLGEIARQFGIPIPKKGRGLDEITDLIKKRKTGVIVFDEADKAERIDDIYPLLSENFVFIFITNNREWIMKLEPRVSSRLFLGYVEFMPYNFEQMLSIIKKRIKLAFSPGSISEDVATEVARRAFLKRDVRVGLFLLRKIGKICEENGLKRAEMDIFERIGEEFKLKPVLNKNEKEIIEILKNMEGKTTGEIYGKYTEKGGKLTQRAFRMYLAKMAEKGILIIKDTGKGFRGRSRRIFLSGKYGV